LSSTEVRGYLIRALVSAPAEDRAARAVVESWDEELSGGCAASVHEEFESVAGLAARIFGRDWATIAERDLRCGGGDR
jgi:hypothetical protein